VTHGPERKTIGACAHRWVDMSLLRGFIADNRAPKWSVHYRIPSATHTTAEIHAAGGRGEVDLVSEAMSCGDQTLTNLCGYDTRRGT
jgi:hypothetical protein